MGFIFVKLDGGRALSGEVRGGLIENMFNLNSGG